MARIRRSVRALAGGGACALALTACLDWESLYGEVTSEPSCGDGRTRGDEECDDANNSDDDACLEGCRAARCGDGKVWLGSEECDDGEQNGTEGDGCSAACRFEVDRCGDGTTESPEECDDGNRIPGDGCSAACTTEPPVELCGNGALDPGEACDDGNRDNTDGCLNGCSLSACGDGFVRRGVEECDDGNHDNGDGCSSVCLSCDTSTTTLFRVANGHCYDYVEKTAGFFGSVSACDAAGGFLWTTTSQAESRDVSRALLVGQPPAWIGLRSDPAPPQWITGESTRYQSWDTGQPLLGASASACAFQNFDGVNPPLWSAAPCADSRPYVCEREPPFVTPDHHAYRLRTAGRTWEVARSRCEESGGHLAIVETEEEQTLLAKHFAVEFWMGGRRDGTDFAWINGAPFSFTAFAAGEPNRADCLAFGRGDAWQDADCTLTKRYVCEYE